MAAEHQYFYEDEVYRINRNGVVEFGMVLENSELVSSDENSDTEDRQKMKKGHIRVAWHPTGVQEIVQEKKVYLADRSLMPGDVVRRLIKGKDTQRGYCRSVHVSSCVQVVGTKQVLINIPSKHLVPVEYFTPDVAVCMNSWVGTIKAVNSKIHLAFADGSKCIISDMDAFSFEKTDDCQGLYPDTIHRHDFHPGQVLQGPVSALEDALWVVCMKETKALKGKPHKNIKVVVEAVETDSVSVHWQCRAFSPNGWCVVDGQPPYVIQGEDLKKLKLLNVFESCSQQIGDHMYYTVKEGDLQITKEQWRAEQKNSHDVAPHTTAVPSRKRKGNRVYLTSADSPLSQSPEQDFEDALSTPPPPVGDVAAPVNEVGPVVDDWETDEADDTGSVSSGCSSNSSAGGGGRGGSGRKKKSQPGLMTKVLKLTKLRRSRRKAPNAPPLKPNAKVVVETLVTSSKADVVWQDGIVETGIPSYQLYPIHHLDDQEFFPGDFVTENKEDGCLRVYGVVQSVDHAGRMAVVNWFHTYTSEDERRPAQLDRKEVSVYDLKDHPDFQYRPGTVAIRVANFEKPDESCTAGQVLDNYPEGRVHVWWVEGHESLCWPQDLYRVGDYDSDEGELWDEGSSEGSWETESEGSAQNGEEEPTVDETMKPKLAANIEKARVAMSRLEELFTQNPALQTIDIMKKLLEVYKDCRYLDKLMGTSFFHESHFQGLLERVREKGRASVGQKVAEQVSRLFQTSVPVKGEEADTVQAVGGTGVEEAEATKVLEFNELNNAKTKEMAVNGQVAVEMDRVNKTIDSLNVTLDKRLVEQRKTEGIAEDRRLHEQKKAEGNLEDRRLQDQRRTEGNSEDELSNSTSTEKSPGSINGHLVQSSSADDSGVFEHSAGFSADVSATHDNCDCLSKPNVALSKSEDKKTTPTFILGAMGTRSLHGSTEKRGKIKFQSQVSCHADSLGPDNDPNSKQVCAKLCALIMSQLVKAHAEVTRRFHVTPALPAEDDDGEEIAEEAVEGEGREDKTDEGDGVGTQGFSIISHAPNGHKYKLTMCQTSDPTLFFKTVRKELALLRTALPPGIWVKGFEDRMDLYSIMIRGPERTPYEDGLFLFDVQLPREYPRAPPLCHYLSYCSDRLNPNLYEDGKVCVSLLGTWSGKGTEVWTLNSNLLQVIVSIQGLILVSEPYFNEAGYEKQKGSQQGRENSRMYNEMAILKLLQAMTKMVCHPPEVFHEEIKSHFAQHSNKLVTRLEKWLDISEQYNAKVGDMTELDEGGEEDVELEQNQQDTTGTETPDVGVLDVVDVRNLQWQKSSINTESVADQPEFPLLPASRGFCLTLRKALTAFGTTLDSVSTS